MNATLILPCCGDSTRFNGGRPKFLLTHPNGMCMLRASIEGLDLKTVDDIVCVVRQDHWDKYKFQDVEKQFDERFRWCILDKPTKGQAETVAEAIAKLGLGGKPIAIKDCDNYFKRSVVSANFVAYASLKDQTLINPSNKSYLELISTSVMDIREKDVISDTFCCGLYCFKLGSDFNLAFQRLQTPSAYISDVIKHMIQKGFTFGAMPVTDYCDWGTKEDWERFRDQYETIFIDLDGVLVRNSGQFTEPRWGTTEALIENVKYIQQKYYSGTTYIVITTSRTQEFEKETLWQLKRHDIPYHKIIWGLPHSKRILINDFAPSNIFPTAISINIPRNLDILNQLI